VEGQEGPDYYFGVEARTASGKTLTIHSVGFAPMVPSGGHDPALKWITSTGVRYTQPQELLDDLPWSVDLLRHLMGDPWTVLERRGSTFLQRWIIDGYWTTVRGLWLPVSYGSTTALELQTPILSTGKPWRLQVRGWATVATGAKVTATVDQGEEIEAPISAVVGPAWNAGWASVDGEALTPGPHVLDVSVIPPPGGSVYPMGLSAYEIPATP